VTVWRQASCYGIPRVAFMNKMDRNNVKLVFVMTELNYYLPSLYSFTAAVESLKIKLHTIPLPIQVLS